MKKTQVHNSRVQGSVNLPIERLRIMKKNKTFPARGFGYLMLALAFLLFSGGEVSAKDRPEWLAGGKIPRFPAQRYLVGVGSGPATGDETADTNRADSAARANIAKQIQVQVKEAITDIQREEEGNKGSAGSVTEVKSESSVDLSLEGVTIAERYFDSKRDVHYSLAVLERSNAAGRLRDKIRDILKAAAEVGKAAQSYESRFQIFLALSNHLRYLNLYQEASSHQLVLRVLAGSSGEMEAFAEGESSGLEKRDLRTEIEKAKTRIQDLLSSLELETAGGDKQKGEVGQPLGEGLKVRVVYEKAASRYPQKGFNVGFVFLQGKGRLLEKVQSGDSGISVSKVYEISAPGDSGVAVVEATLLPDGLSKEGELEPNFSQALKRARADFTIDLPSKRFVVKIFETNAGQPVSNSVVEGEIVQGLVSQGFPVIEQKVVLEKISETTLRSGNIPQIVGALRSIAEVVIIGEVQAAESSRMGQIVFSRARGTVRAVRTDTGKILATADIEVKDGGNDPVRAGQRAIQKLAPSIASQVLTGLAQGLK